MLSVVTITMLRGLPSGSKPDQESAGNHLPFWACQFQVAASHISWPATDLPILAGRLSRTAQLKPPARPLLSGGLVPEQARQFKLCGFGRGPSLTGAFRSDELGVGVSFPVSDWLSLRLQEYYSGSGGALSTNAGLLFDLGQLGLSGSWLLPPGPTAEHYFSRAL